VRGQSADLEGVMMRVAVSLLVGFEVFAAEGPAAGDAATRIKAAMAPSLEKQRASIRLQVEKAQQIPAPPSDFFTIPFPTLAVVSAVARPECDPLPRGELDPIIDNAAQRHGVGADLVRAVIQKESSGRPCAVSVKGAQGLMQIMPATADQFEVADPFDPKQNVEAGTRFLKQLLDRFKGDLARALGAYNAGPGAVEREGGVPQNAETLDYVTTILKMVGK
jgi:soluble lytic murein transglycosylase-like protein